MEKTTIDLFDKASETQDISLISKEQTSEIKEKPTIESDFNKI
jgi:hypothetical protein